MGKVIGFPQSPLTPFIGKWLLDPLSVSRNKVVKRTLGEDRLKKLWAFDSMQERAEYLAADPELAARYDALRRSRNDSHLVVTQQTIAFTWPRPGSPEGKTTVYPVVRVSAEGRKAIVHTVNGPERGNQPILPIAPQQAMAAGERTIHRACGAVLSSLSGVSVLRHELTRFGKRISRPLASAGAPADRE